MDYDERNVFLGIMIAFLIFLLSVHITAQDSVVIRFTVPTDKIEDIKEAMWKLHPVPMINVGDSINIILEPQFNKSQWAKECVRRWIAKQLRRYDETVERDSIIARRDQRDRDGDIQ